MISDLGKHDETRGIGLPVVAEAMSAVEEGNTAAVRRWIEAFR